MKFTILKSTRIGTYLPLAAFVVVGLGCVVGVSAQDKRTTTTPSAKQKPAKKTTGTGTGTATGAGVGNGTGAGTGVGTGAGVGTANGSGIGAANGTGIGAANGTGIGTPSGNGMGTPSGEGLGVRRVIIIGSSSGDVVGSPMPTDPLTGTVDGTTTTVPAASVKTDQKPVVLPRTYIKDSDSRCYYVTITGSKHFVARANCSLYR